MIHWFKKHPEFLRQESEALSNDNNYKQLFQERDKSFISHGNILVRLDKIYRFPVLIAYTDSTPYELPVIFPLKEVLDAEFVKQLSRLEIGDLRRAIYDKIEFHYHVRHQNSSGALCVLEWDNLDDGTKFYGIKTILKRVKDWCAGLITGNFPPDSQEVEFLSHFNQINLDIKFFYPENYLDESVIEGESYAILYNRIPKGIYFNIDKKIYFGCLIVGKNSSGIITNLEFNLPHYFVEEGIKSPLDLYNKKEIIAARVSSGLILKNFWFNISVEPKPFNSFTELIDLIGGGNQDDGLRRFHSLCYEDLKLKPDFFHIAIRFPNRKGGLEYQLFKVYKNDTPVETLIGIQFDPVEISSLFAKSYTKIEAIDCEKLTDEHFHERNNGRANRDVLKEAIINIVGVGALGSEIADSLAKAGIGTITLFDNQTLKGHNTVRHLAGFNSVGFPKVQAVAEILHNHNPFVTFHPFALNINDTYINDFFLDNSISISSIADDNVEAFLNERAVISGKTVYYSRALRGGKAARIFRVIPGRDACFHCLNLYRSEKSQFIDIPDDPTLPTLKNECNNPVRPASAADLKLISSLTSRILIDQIQSDFNEINHWIWSTEALAETEPPLLPFNLLSQYIPPHSKCQFCHHEVKSKIIIKKGAIDFMSSLVLENPLIETGGVLAGYVEIDGTIMVNYASEPGPKAVKTSVKFEKDVDFCQKFLDDLFVEFNNKAIYLGEWHSHPSKNNKPSSTDINSLTDISYQKEYLTDAPISIIMSNTGLPSCTVHPVGKTFYYVEPTIV